MVVFEDDSTSMTSEIDLLPTDSTSFKVFYQICFADPCKGVKCKNYGVCKANPSAPKGYKCACRECTTVVSPVCGSDKRTHKSECFLRRASCRENKYLFVTHKGPCGR